MKALDDEAPPPLETSSSTSAYGLELGFAYIATPFLAVGITGLVLAADPDAGLGGVALAVVLASTPAPIVHALNGHGGRALAAGLAAPALFFGGAFVGTLVSLAVITAADPIDTPEEQEDGALVHGLTALAIGLCTGLAAYTTWAILDVSWANRGDRRSRSYTRLQLGVVPRRDGASAVLATRF
jgi:hypothetical protein